MKKLTFEFEGQRKKFTAPTHAALFRDFFEFWKDTSEELVIKGTFGSGLRLSPKEYFEGTVIKKKNLKIVDDLYIITHITPQAMDKGIFKFLDTIDATIIDPKPKAKESKKSKNKDDEYVPESEKLNAKKAEETEEDLEKLPMAERVEASMKMRDEKIKERLAGGNREAKA
jgi:hypothetical protein